MSQLKARAENIISQSYISLGVIPSSHVSEASPLISWWEWDYDRSLEKWQKFRAGFNLPFSSDKTWQWLGFDSGSHPTESDLALGEQKWCVSDLGLSSCAWSMITANPGEGWVVTSPSSASPHLIPMTTQEARITIIALISQRRKWKHRWMSTALKSGHSQPSGSRFCFFARSSCWQLNGSSLSRSKQWGPREKRTGSISAFTEAFIKPNWTSSSHRLSPL